MTDQKPNCSDLIVEMKVCPFMSGALKKITRNDPEHYAPSTSDEPTYVCCIGDKCMLWGINEHCLMVMK